MISILIHKSACDILSLDVESRLRPKGLNSLAIKLIYLDLDIESRGVFEKRNICNMYLDLEKVLINLLGIWVLSSNRSKSSSGKSFELENRIFCVDLDLVVIT